MKSIKFLESKNAKFKIIELEEIPKSAQDVERLYSCSLNQVLKTVVFVGEKEPVLVVLPGDKKVNIEKLKQITKQEKIRMAKPDEVKEITGYSIGGVSPFGIEKDILKILDKSIFKNEIINIGSGEAKIGIEMNSEELKKIWDGIVDNIVE